jgi:hypothetical protein
MVIWYLKISLLRQYLGVLISDTLLATRTNVIRLLLISGNHATGSHVD